MYVEKQNTINQVDVEFILSVYITVLEAAKAKWKKLNNNEELVENYFKMCNLTYYRIAKSLIMESFLSFSEKEYDFTFLCDICFFGIFISNKTLRM